MKSLTTLTCVAVLTVASSSAFAQGCKGGGGSNWRPTPLPHPLPHPMPHPTPQPWPQPLPQPHPTPQPICHPPKIEVRPAMPTHPPVVHHPVKTCLRPVMSQPPREEPPVPVIPQQAAVALPEVQPGQELTIDGRFFGYRAGRAILQVSTLKIPATILDWSPSTATFVLPSLPIDEPVKATIRIESALGAMVEKVDVLIIPEQIVEPEPALEVPTVTGGQEVALSGSNPGRAIGQVRVKVQGLALRATVLSWDEEEITTTLPSIDATEPFHATIQIVRADGSIADQLEVLFVPDTDHSEIARR